MGRAYAHRSSTVQPNISEAPYPMANRSGPVVASNPQSSFAIGGRSIGMSASASVIAPSMKAIRSRRSCRSSMCPTDP
jgi:hypothetical protein